MACCAECGQEMLDGVSCLEADVVFPDGRKMPQVRYVGERCHDCACPNGGFHHPGCDMERCPRCGGQLISCGCLDDENDDVC